MRQFMRARQGGVVLVAVLWVMVGMTLAASVFALWVEKSRERAAELLAETELQHRVRSLEAAVIYTRVVSAGGPEGVPWPQAGESSAESAPPMFDSLEEFLSGAPPKRRAASAAGFMRMDGSVLRQGDLRLRVQDHGGLIGLLDADNERLFEHLAKGRPGITAERLRATLVDYMDADQLHLLQGAEAPEYQRLGRALPLDGVLRSPLQLRDLIAWDEALAERSDEWLLRNFRIGGGSFVNVNTAPLSAMELVVPEPSVAANLAARRRERPLRSSIEAHADMGGGEDLYVGVEPDSGLRIWWWREDGTAAVVDDIQFDPFEPGRDAIRWNWSARVALSERVAEDFMEEVDHPLFHAPSTADR